MSQADWFSIGCPIGLAAANENSWDLMGNRLQIKIAVLVPNVLKAVITEPLEMSLSPDECQLGDIES